MTMTAFTSTPKPMNANARLASMGWTRALFGTRLSTTSPALTKPTRSAVRQQTETEIETTPGSTYNGWKGQRQQQLSPVRTSTPDPFFQDVEARFDRIHSPYRAARGPSAFRVAPTSPVVTQAFAAGVSTTSSSSTCTSTSTVDPGTGRRVVYNQTDPLVPPGQRRNRYIPCNAASFVRTMRERQRQRRRQKQPFQGNAERPFVVPTAEAALATAGFQGPTTRPGGSPPAAAPFLSKGGNGRVIQQGVRLHPSGRDPIYGRIPGQRRKKLRFVEEVRREHAGDPKRQRREPTPHKAATPDDDADANTETELMDWVKQRKLPRPERPEEETVDAALNNGESSKRRKLTYRQQATNNGESSPWTWTSTSPSSSTSTRTTRVVTHSKRQRDLSPHQPYGAKKLRFKFV